jgi:amino acid adenylation domain-containing protein/non-ribosomal peptide synthase protein (TIGR01720 family)
MVPTAYVSLAELPLTANGKLDRAALPAPDGVRPDLDESFVSPRTPLEKQLAEIWSQVIGVKQIGLNDNFFELGGDSILSIQIVARANQAGLRFTPRQLFQHQNIAELAEVIDIAPALEAEQGLITGNVKLTPIQHWFFEQNLTDPHHWNQSRLLKIKEPIDPALMEQVVDQLLLQHDALRLRFSRSENGWQQVHANGKAENVFTRIILSGNAEQQIAAIESHAAELQASLNLSSGPLVRVTLFESDEQTLCRLLIVIHHLVVDGVSWRVLLYDLQTAYQQARQGTAISLPPKTTSFKQWTEMIDDYVSSPALEPELEYWLAESRSRIRQLPRDFFEGENSEALAGAVVVSLSAEDTESLLREVPAAYRTQINDVLLTALVQALNEWTGESSQLIDLEGHGREQIVENVDLSRTIGWFTTIFPVLLEVRPGDVAGEALKAIKEQLREVANRGIGYGLLRYLKNDAAIAERLEALPQAEVVFNYQGQFDSILPENSIFARATENVGPIHSARGNRRHALSINSGVSKGRLQLVWTYSQNIHRHSTIERLADRFLDALRSLISHCRSPEAGGYTPSDFPLAGLDQTQLDRVTAKDRRIEDIYTLSPMQQGLLFHALYTSSSDIYTIQLNYTLRGNLNVAALKQALQQVVHRHSILRTFFAWQSFNEPLQIVRQNVSVPWEYQDYRGLSTDEQQQRLRTFLEADKRKGFDIGRAPLARFTVIQLSDQDHQLVWNTHNLLMDGWSLPLLLKEIFSFYAAFSQGHTLFLKPTRPYRDYIVWLRQQNLSEAETFWRQTLKGFTAPTPLGVDRAVAAPTRPAEAYDKQILSLSSETTSALRLFARHHQLTLNTVVEGAWALLLSSYSGERDIVFGATVSGRPPSLDGIESMVGVFTNTLPVRVRVCLDTLLLPWLKDLQEQQLKIRQFEYSPLMQVQAWSELTRGASLFETIFVFENYPVKGLSAEHTQLNITNVNVSEMTHYALSVLVATNPNLSLKIFYDCNRFDVSTIKRMLGHMQVLLKAIATNPKQRLGELSLLSEPEREQLLVQFNDTHTEFPREACVQQLFETQVERTPDAIAIVCDDERLTYAELNRRANQLAHHLQTLGVGPEIVVGICVTRSVKMVVGALGILKAGGAYAPIDPTYPGERIAFMVEDAGAPVLLTERRLLESLPACDALVVCLDDEEEMLARESDVNLACSARPDNVAYVIFTSGSTGKPKGVAVQQRSLVNLLSWHQLAFSISAADRATQLASLAFDAAVWEIWPYLTAGSTIYLFDQCSALTPEQSRDWLIQNQITICFMPTPLAETVLDIEWPTETPLRLLLVGGDKLHRYGERALPFRVVNNYGPTESTVVATSIEITEDQSKGEEPSIGLPISNTRVYIVGQGMKVVPVGVTGELLLGGEGLARGYLNRVELTAQSFIPDPFSGRVGERLYQTGDLCRYRVDGRLEYLGRLDQQVKIRGFRIELGEVEAVLRQHADIREAVVLAREDEPGDKRLVAYLVQEPELRVSELREWLKQKLPDSMQPSAFMRLEELPLTTNGKVDRAALPAPKGTRPELEDSYLAPRTPIEEVVAGIWGEVLKVERVGVHDNFFELGGDSLKAIQVISRVQSFSEVEVRVRSIFEAPTVAELCLLLPQMEDDLAVKNEIAQLLSELEKMTTEKAQALLFSEANR